METYLKNKLIAEFMNFKTQTDAVDDRVLAYYIGDVINADNSNNENEENVFHPDDMLFNKSWDWLMSVVDKIDKLMLDQPIDSPFEINAEEVFTSLREVNIKLTFNKIVEFIEWYNEQFKN